MDGIRTLLTLQDHDRKIIHLQRESRDIPKRKAEIEGRLSGHQEALHSAQEDLKRHGLKMRELEGEVEAIEAKISRFKEQQMSVKSNEDYRALDREIALARRQVKKLEDQELSLMEEVEGLTAAVTTREQELAEEEKAVREEVKSLDARLVEIEQEVDALMKDRPALSEGIDPAWLSRYERILKHVGDVALVGISKSGVCMGCYMQLPPQMTHDARKSDSITTCSFCGRILFDGDAWNT